GSGGYAAGRHVVRAGDDAPQSQRPLRRCAPSGGRSRESRHLSKRAMVVGLVGQREQAAGLAAAGAAVSRLDAWEEGRNGAGGVVVQDRGLHAPEESLLPIGRIQAGTGEESVAESV